MRIISGKYKGRRISAPKKLPVRPTTDMAKEGLFNVLNNDYYFDEFNVLDLFAGTGNMSYEFASRGTKHITCVDKNTGCIGFINKTAKEFEMDLITIKSDVYSFLEKSKSKFNLIFADPPYGFPEEDFVKIVDLIFHNDLLEEDGIIIIEHSKHTILNTHTNFTKDRRYGGSVFSFFEQ